MDMDGFNADGDGDVEVVDFRRGTCAARNCEVENGVV